MRISVIMIDGQFREHTYGADYFSKQDYPDGDYEIIWVEFYSQVPASVRENKKIRVVTLNNPPEKTYHSSFCFNRGIKEATGELIVIPDADQIVRPDFLSELSKIHSSFDKLVVYSYRYDEIKKGDLNSLSFDELERKCGLKNSQNYGGCLSVRKKWLLEINGYEQHKFFESGFHANGLDMYTRFRNFGMAIMWAPQLKLYHPWHPFTLAPADQYKMQKELISWRLNRREYLSIEGMDTSKNSISFNESDFLNEIAQRKNKKNKTSLIKRLWKKIV